MEGFKKEPVSVFVMATHYEGDPPDDASPFWDNLSALSEPQLFSLNKYFIYALGDLTYKHYCGFGKSVSKKLTELGATLLYELGLGSNDRNTIEAQFIKWREGIWTELLKIAPKNETNGQQPATGAKFVVSLENSGEETLLSSIEAPEKYDVNASKLIRAFDVKVLKIQELRQKSSPTESTLHIELQLPAGKTYRTACNALVFPENTTENVNRALQVVGLAETQLIRIQSAGGDTKLPCPELVTAGTFFRRWVDLQGVLKKSTLKALAKIVGGETQKQLERIAGKEGEKEFEEFSKKQFGIIDIITNFDIKLSISQFVEIGSRILPRYFTVSSSSHVKKDIMTLTAAIDNTDIGGQTKYGLASAYFQALHSQLESGKSPSIRLDIVESTFDLPVQSNTSVADKLTKCIFIATGAGYAPFHGMATEKAARSGSPSNPWGDLHLFFGVRNSEHDYLYKKEIASLKQNGTYNSVFEAFSRQDVVNLD